MSNVIHIYKAVKDASQNEALAQAIAEAFDEANSRYPNLANTATQRDLSETELRLMAEIEKTRGEIKATELQIKDVELKLSKEIDASRLKVTKEIDASRLEVTKEIDASRLEVTKEINASRLEVTKEIEALRIEVTKEIDAFRIEVTKEIEALRLDLTKEMGKQTMKTVGYLTTIMGLFYAIVRFVPA